MNHSNQLIHINDSNHSIIIWILIGLIAGYITGKLMRGSGFGPIMDIVVGILGKMMSLAEQRGDLLDSRGEPGSRQ